MSAEPSGLTPVLRRTVVLLLTGLMALVSTTVTLQYERLGPELAAYGNLCGPEFNEACLEPVLNAGFPFAFLFDRPGVSVQHQLSLGEDEFRPARFAADLGLFWAGYLALLQLARWAWPCIKRRGRG